MVIFTIALVPLYDVFCEVTGLNGKPRRVDDAALQAALSRSQQRPLQMQFVTRVGQGLPVQFRSQQAAQRPVVGGRNQTHFTFENQSDTDLLVRTVPSISPPEASPHILKIECFCFQEMVLKAGEKKQVGLMYLVGAKLPDHVAAVTLSYTVYPVADAPAVAEEASL
ncbi:cytochrome c oxidase assembly protein [Bacterioplanes sanyensis]|uniref:cytochrome c oxidase assembly protein n=1 Tax=Bacterioplanes sanyensis TaxID=1249553 RepID=UPI001E3EB951|nr:cytochrome c oxidase assembly protein [Bacterioplanes sanyensis]